MATSSAQIGSAAAWAAGYTGAGRRIAVIDTGIDPDHQSFDDGAFQYSLEKNAEKAGMTKQAYVDSLDLLDKEEIARVYDKLNVSWNDHYKPGGVSFASDSMYMTSKIPFAFNYVDKSLNVSHDNDSMGEHGSHVEGIAAANAYIPSGDGTYTSALDAVKVQGVAPDAQIIVMKVFGKNGGAFDSDYLSAIEDAIVLGADAINLSLGSGNPGMSHHLTPTYQAVMDTLVDYGTVVAISAGNNGAWPEYSGNPYLYADDVATQTGGAPGSFTNSLAVASVENDGYTGMYFSVGDDLVFYTETLYKNKALATLAGTHEYVFCGGQNYGSASDWALAGETLKGKIAVCYRGGGISFVDKATAAAEAGAIGVIICNNESGIINMDLSSYQKDVPCVSAAQDDGKTLWNAATPQMGTNDEGDEIELYRTGTLTVSDEISTINYNSEFQTMSSFSSWGVPGTLEMKPEITAPGGNIYSVNGLVPGGKAYETMSGTSMAAPQVAGMAALMSQYIEKAGLAEKTGRTPRQLSQSLLMSTATAMRDTTEAHNFYSVLQQGAGLANIGAAIAADSYLWMGEDATASYADGKVKAELGDDPAKTGEYSFSFSINNLTGEEKSYDLAADLFTQALLQDTDETTGAVTNYMDYATEPLSCDVAWTVNGEAFVPDHSEQKKMDFNGDGAVTNEDCTALLEYVIGARETLNDQENADLNGDGKITSYDAYLFLHRQNGGAVAVPANGKVDVTVTMTLSAEQKARLNANFPKGAYIEGFVTVETATTAEGAAGTKHSIPVLGFYGNWSEPSMFEVGSYIDYYQGVETRTPYLTQETNAFGVTYASDPYNTYIFGGNPLGRDAEYKPERNAINSNDRLTQMLVTAIRNGIDTRLTVFDETQNKALFDKTYGPISCAYYIPASDGWADITHLMNVQTDLTAAREGDKLTFSFSAAPEYYLDAEGKVDWKALGKGASLITTAIVDNTAPVIAEDGVRIDTENKKLYVTASDNQYISAVVLYNSSGSTQLASADAKMDIAAGETAEYELDLSKVNGKGFLVQVYDYAMNTTTYVISDQIGELNPAPDTIAFGLDYNKWYKLEETTSYGSTYYQYIALREEAEKNTYYAAAFADPIVFASTPTGDLYAMPKEDLTDCKLVGNLGVVLTDMAYCKTNDTIYGVYSKTRGDEHHSYLVSIDKRSGLMTQVGEIGLWTNTLACDAEGNFYCNKLETGEIYTFTEGTLASPTLLVTVGRASWGTTEEYPSTDHVQSMEIDPDSGKLFWASYRKYTASLYPGLPAYVQTDPNYWEIDVAAKTFKSYSSYYQMSGLTFLKSEEGTDTSWAEPTENIESVRISETELTLLRGEHTQLSAAVVPWTSLNRNINWSSSDESVAEVDALGTVLATGSGTCTIKAASVTDPTKFATCEVTVELLDLTIKGAVQDEDSNPQLFSWNMHDDNWTKTADLLSPAQLTSMTRNEKTGNLYIMSAVDPYTMYEVDAQTGKYIDEAVNTLEVPWWDMAYSTKYSTDTAPAVVGIFNSYLFVPQDPMNQAGDPLVFNMEPAFVDYGGSHLVAIANMGEMDVTYFDDTTQMEKTVDAERYFLLDNIGNLIDLYLYTNEDGYNILRTRYTSNLSDYERFMGDETGNMYCSMVKGDDGNVYLSAYDGTSSWLYRLTLDDQAMFCEATSIGDMGLNVWPAALYEVKTNTPASGTDAVVLHDAAQMKAIAFTADMLAETSAEGTAKAANRSSGSLNVAPATALPRSVAASGQDKDIITVQITAKDAGGSDIASTNGKLTATYDASVFELKKAEMHTPYFALKQTEGSVAMAYASSTELPAGTAVATLTLARKGDKGGDVLVTHHEAGDTMPDYAETLPIADLEPDPGPGPVDPGPVDPTPGPVIPTPNPVKPVPGGQKDDHDATCPSKDFADLSSSQWYHTYTDFVISEGLMKGVSGNLFAPNATLTRAMLVQILYRVEGEPAAEGGVFADVADGAWYADAVNWAAANKIVTGYNQNHFGPDDTITRQQLAAILWRYAQYKNISVAANGTVIPEFTDRNEIEDWAAEAISWAYSRGILTGKGNALDPAGNATRAEAAAMICRFYNLEKDTARE